MSDRPMTEDEKKAQEIINVETFALLAQMIDRVSDINAGFSHPAIPIQIMMDAALGAAIGIYRTAGMNGITRFDAEVMKRRLDYLLNLPIMMIDAHGNPQSEGTLQ